MLKINKGEPWVMWPDKMVANFIEYPANKIFEYDGNYKFVLIFELNEDIISKSTLFCKLPSYLGIDLELNGITFIVTETNTDTMYEFKNYIWQSNKQYKLVIEKVNNKIDILINNEVIFEYVIKNKIASDTISHILFGAGNFPKNGINLNYINVTLHHLEIIKENSLICKHRFETFIHNKSFDETDNCNFIYKI
jgi:hypothetical protein